MTPNLEPCCLDSLSADQSEAIATIEAQIRDAGDGVGIVADEAEQQLFAWMLWAENELVDTIDELMVQVNRSLGRIDAAIGSAAINVVDQFDLALANSAATIATSEPTQESKEVEAVPELLSESVPVAGTVPGAVINLSCPAPIVQCSVPAPPYTTAVSTAALLAQSEPLPTAARASADEAPKAPELAPLENVPWWLSLLVDDLTRDNIADLIAVYQPLFATIGQSKSIAPDLDNVNHPVSGGLNSSWQANLQTGSQPPPGL